MGFPVGRPQTIVVDLRGRLEPGEREIRIQTNMRIFWDQIQVGTPSQAAPRVSRIDPVVADLGWRGFSAEKTSEGEPLTYDYHAVTAVSPWKVPVGRYTREGDVRELLRTRDDLFVISKPGDQIALSFDVASLPALPQGWTRTLMLYAYGYSKEMNIRSASPDTVEPLPFFGMTGYPYGPAEQLSAGRGAPTVRGALQHAHRESRRSFDRSSHPGESMTHIRYSAAACQTDLPNPLDRQQMTANTDRMLSMIDSAVAGAAPFLPVRLVVVSGVRARGARVSDRCRAGREAGRCRFPTSTPIGCGGRPSSTTSTSSPGRCSKSIDDGPASCSTPRA